MLWEDGGNYNTGQSYNLTIDAFGNHLIGHLDGVPLRNRFAALSEVPAETDLSRRISKELKAEGFRFCGPTIVYAFMQATGMVNDHLVTCPSHDRVARLAG